MTYKEVDKILNDKFKETIASEVRQFVAMSGNMAIYADIDEKDIYANKMHADLSEYKRIAYHVLFGEARYKDLRDMKEKEKKSMISCLKEHELKKLEKFYKTTVKFMDTYKEVPNFVDLLDYKRGVKPSKQWKDKAVMANPDETTLINRRRTINFFSDLV